MKSDYKVPSGLAEKLANEYKQNIIIDPDDGTLDYDSTLDVFAERIMLEYSDDKIKRVFGQPIENTVEMSKWLAYNVPDLYEILLKMNHEL